MISAKAERFTESVIREMTLLAMQHGAVNLAQGFPDFPAPDSIKQAAQEAIARDINQYAITWGAKSLRDAIAAKFARTQGVEVDPEKHITVCCGSTEAMMAAMMAVINPGDEVVVFEPFYENYGPDAILSGATPRFVKLRPPQREQTGARDEGPGEKRQGAQGADKDVVGTSKNEWTFDREELAAAFGEKTKAIILNTPNNPTGKIFTRGELEFIRDLCVRWNALAITDEIYEHILYDGEHISMAALEGMGDRTITINGMSKTYSVTGWRVGWAIAPPRIASAIRKVHDFLTVGAAAPLQEAGALALSLPPAYYGKMAADYRVRRDKTMAMLTGAGFHCYPPAGAYYIMTDISGFNFPNDISFAKYLIEEIGVAPVPGSSFYNDARDGAQQVRFCFCKTDKTLDAAAERLQKLRSL
jgi:aminotransferase